MRQVPAKYLVIGNGRMATHLCHYFQLLSIEYRHWYRRKYSSSQLQQLLPQATHVLLLINDDAIIPFVNEHLSNYTHLKLIHFSGALTTQNAYSAHPLCVFNGKHPYSLEEYQSIPFILEESSPNMSILLPKLQNPYFKIKANEKAYYHALCVMANNFSTLIWQKFFDEMQSKFSLPENDLLPFLTQTFNQIKQYPDIEHAGPLMRNDQNTLKANLKALQNDSFQSIYKSFIDTFSKGTFK